MTSLGPKKVGADQVFGPEFLVSFTVSSFSIDRYSFQQSFKCNTYVFLEILQNLQENTCVRVSFLIKSFIKKESLEQVFSCEFC